MSTKSTSKSAPRGRFKRPSVRELIRDLIIDGGYRGGDPLPPEGRLADELGVSRSSVREAVQSLAATGVIEVRHGIGLFVQPFSLQPLVNGLQFALLDEFTEIQHLLELRQTIESGVAEQVITAFDDAQDAAFAECLQAMGDKARAGQQFSAEDRAFHNTLVQNLKNPLYGSLTDAFWMVFNRASAVDANLSDTDPLKSFADHQAIVAALRARDADAYCQAVAAHYALIQDRVARAGDAAGSTD